LAHLTLPWGTSSRLLAKKAVSVTDKELKMIAILTATADIV